MAPKSGGRRREYGIEVESDRVLKPMRRFPASDQRRLIERMRQLATDPRPPGCEKLEGGLGWRIRSGNYRIIYRIDDTAGVVVITKVGDRKEVYD